jgi:hypothetical protein
MEYKRCYNCKFWALHDSGYSNYTVTETTVYCLKDHFEPIEESYSWNKSRKNPENDHEFFKQAENCGDFKQETGVQIHLDVDGDVTIEDFKEDSELYEAAKSWGL